MVNEAEPNNKGNANGRQLRNEVDWNVVGMKMPKENEEIKKLLRGISLRA
jgi:hypothetical protein